MSSKRAQRRTTSRRIWVVRASGLVRPSALVVDDDPLVRRALARQLAPAFEVLQAGTLASALAALERFETLTPPKWVSLAFVDYELPDGTGLPILERLSVWPDNIRVLMSGNVKQLADLRACGSFVPLVLGKPLNFNSIEAAKRAALAVLEGQQRLN